MESIQSFVFFRGSLHLMLNGWFGSRWFRFLGSPKIPNHRASILGVAHLLFFSVAARLLQFLAFAQSWSQQVREKSIGLVRFNRYIMFKHLTPCRLIETDLRWYLFIPWKWEFFHVTKGGIYFSLPWLWEGTYSSSWNTKIGIPSLKLTVRTWK